MFRNRHVFRVLSVVSFLIIAGCRPNASAPTLPKKSPLDSSGLQIQASVNLGVLGQGESGRIVQWVRNTSDKKIFITQIEKSCECLEVRLRSMELLPDDRVLAAFIYDGSKEPDFVGSLLIDVKLSDAEGNNVGRIEVAVEVVSGQEVLKL